MASLAGATIASTFKSLLKLAGNTDDLVAGASGAGKQVMTGDGESTILYLNTDRVGIGESAPESPLHITTPDTSYNLTLESTDADVNSGPDVRMLRVTGAGVANDYLGHLHFIGNDASSNATTYADIVSIINDPSASAEVGELRLRCISGASIQNTLCLKGKDVGIGTASPDAPLHIKTASVSATVIIESTGDSAESNPELKLIASHVDKTDGDDIGGIFFQAKNSDDVLMSYSSIVGEIVDDTTSTEDGALYFKTDVNSSHANRLAIVGDNVGIGTTTFDSSVAGYLAITNGTQPSAHTDDQIYIGAKNASTTSESTLALYCEEDPVAHDSGGAYSNSHKMKVWINGTEYWIVLDGV